MSIEADVSTKRQYWCWVIRREFSSMNELLMSGAYGDVRRECKHDRGMWSKPLAFSIPGILPRNPGNRKDVHMNDDIPVFPPFRCIPAVRFRSIPVPGIAGRDPGNRL